MDAIWPHMWQQVGLTSAAFFLCSLLGLERQIHQKSAGVRTHALVGTGACVFTLVSVYGFLNFSHGSGVVEPARIAAQIVTGIGFLGAGVIFVNRDVVRGLTTAATIWLAAAMGMACGAGMVPLAALALALHFIAVLVIGPLVRLLPAPERHRILDIVYTDGRGILRDVMLIAGQMGFDSQLISTSQEENGSKRLVAARIRFRGGVPLHDLATQLLAVKGVQSVTVAESTDGEE